MIVCFRSRRARGSAARVEELEARQTLSAPSYAVVDLLGALPGNTSIVDAVGINNAGTVALNTFFPVTGGRGAQSYTYSARRHRAYRVPDNITGNNSTSSVSGLVAINDKDQLATINELRNVDGSWIGNSDVITSLNNRGQAVGSAFVAFGGGGGGGGAITQPVVFDSSLQAVALPPATFPPEFPDTAVLINDNGIIGARGYLYDTTTSTPTALPAGDEYVSALSNRYAAGRYGDGFYLYDLRGNTQRIVPAQNGASDFVPTGVNDDGVVVGTALFYRRVRNHTQRLNDAAVYQGGAIYDLNSLVGASTPSRLVDPTGINAAGQIVVNAGDDIHAYLLRPTSG